MAILLQVTGADRDGSDVLDKGIGHVYIKPATPCW